MKKINYLFLFFMVVSSNLFSQDSLKKKFKHSIGAEIQKNHNSSRIDGHRGGYVSYHTFGYGGFYRLEFKEIVVLESRSFYRKGYGSYGDGGLGGGIYTSGQFQFIRTDLGISVIAGLNRTGSIRMGSGIKAGFMVYQTGNLMKVTSGHTGSSSLNGYSTTEDKPAREVLNQVYFCVHTDIQARIKVSKRNAICPGFRFYLETPDYPRSGLHFSLGLNVAYLFRS